MFIFVRKKFNPIRQHSSIDQNLLFLSNFDQWLKAWEELGVLQQERSGKLSKETCFALRHTTSTLIKLCDYLLQHQNFQYVLLGKFQTDNLEYRFSQYRKMSGTNYNVSVAQVMEYEKKLKVMNVLSMAKAKFGPLSISNLSFSKCEPDSQSGCDDHLEKFKGTEEYLEEKSLTKDDENAMVFIAGYVVHSIKKKLKCPVCVSRVSLDEKLEGDVPDNCQCLKILDRGGLKWPTDFTLSVCRSTYQVFEALISNFKEDFVQCNNQKEILVQLALNVQEKAFDMSECCPCKVSVEKLLRMCIWPITIFY